MVELLRSSVYTDNYAQLMVLADEEQDTEDDSALDELKKLLSQLLLQPCVVEAFNSGSGLVDVRTL